MGVQFKLITFAEKRSALFEESILNSPCSPISIRFAETSSLVRDHFQNKYRRPAADSLLCRKQNIGPRQSLICLMLWHLLDERKTHTHTLYGSMIHWSWRLPILLVVPVLMFCRRLHRPSATIITASVAIEFIDFSATRHASLLVSRKWQSWCCGNARKMG